MTVKIVKEVTDWKVPYRQPNHVYLMSGDRVVAMSRWGKEGIVRTERDGFLVRDAAALERLAEA